MTSSVLIMIDFNSVNVSLPRPLPRTTTSEKPAEGPWQVSVVPAQADEVTAEHRPNTKVSTTSWFEVY